MQKIKATDYESNFNNRLLSEEKPTIKHLLFGADGSRRWAVLNDTSFEESYDLGARKVSEMITWCFEEDLVDELSLWILQEYNLTRPSEQVKIITKAVMDCMKYIGENKSIEEYNLQLRVYGELDPFFAIYEGSRVELNEILQKSEGNTGKKVNVLLSYNGSKELNRAYEKCQIDDVEPTLGNLSERWSFSPVTLFYRSGQPDNFNRLSDYYPGIEQARLKSTTVFLQDLNKNEVKNLFYSFHNLKDSYTKL